MDKRSPLFISILILVLSLTVAATVKRAQASESEFYDVYIHADREELGTFRAIGMSIDGVGPQGVRAYASSEAIAELDRLGYLYYVIPKVKRPAFYPTLSQALNAISSYATTYSDIMCVDQIGTSAGGHPIYAVRITDNPDTEEVEPEVLFECNIHGDEGIGLLNCLNFIEYLGDNYGSNEGITALVDGHEILVVPLLNPDGYAADTRYNGHSVDLNRNFGFWWDGWMEYAAGSSPLSEPESQAMTWFAMSNNPALDMSYHSGAECVDYPFDSHKQHSSDESNFSLLGYAYANTTGYITWVTNGWDWYSVYGITTEQYYGSCGTLSEVTEISWTKQPTSESAIDTYLNANLPAMLDWVAKSDWGVHGTITDQSGDPVEAMVVVQELDWPAYSDPIVGDYHRFLQAGSYNLWVWANGYQPQLIPITIAKDGEATTQDVVLEPSGEGKTYAFKVIAAYQPLPYDQTGLSYPTWTLGPPDGKSASLGKAGSNRGGYVILDMGANSPVTDGDGVDFKVIEGDSDTNPEGYTVYASQNWLGPWSLVGNGNGTTDFDLASSGLSEARYLKIADDGDGSTGKTSGMELDAVETTVHCSAPVADFSAEPTTGPAPLDVQFRNLTDVETGCLSSSRWEFGDEQSSDESAPLHTYTEPGTYTVSLTATGPGGSDTETKEDYIVVTSGSDDDADDDSDDDGGDDDDGGGCGC